MFSIGKLHKEGLPKSSEGCFLLKQGDYCEGGKKGQVKQIGEFFIDLWPCHIRLKIAEQGLVFSVFLWDLFLLESILL